mmetsp:Transcript_9778/g.14300  ORF Transcript_9778/g.14300 Transcript_9778/m.14300 type:complete len:225 (+) Transcript_9778:86-760(+)|eukprot:CAMPEP_0195516134 /NCGR_PEP_ID=MMETSP0794_2-20130614/6956_1 /TAXON_ID=515487 /ORGANISM="Stephanopyxis turris, Strain CCMP 815" /LENGTH=224 /DNA_ID=CAMNT_0040644655 /DNA_START=35 /DNA_END=709 /DNA_ORIENTATION=-
MRRQPGNHPMLLFWAISLLCFVNWSCVDDRNNHVESFLLPCRINRRTIPGSMKESVRQRNSTERRRRSGIFQWGGSQARSSSNNENDGGDDDANNNNNNKSELKKGARFGGRARRRMWSRTAPSTPKSASTPPLKKINRFGCGSLIGVVLLLSILKSLLFGGGGSYTYYESSYFESRSYDRNGQIQTTRKESVRTNIPNVRRDIIRSGEEKDGPLEKGYNAFLK